LSVFVFHGWQIAKTGQIYSIREDCEFIFDELYYFPGEYDELLSMRKKEYQYKKRGCLLLLRQPLFLLDL
jgi:hypothetical protein